LLRRRLLPRALGWFVGFDSRGAFELHHRRGETSKSVLIEVDDRVMFIDEPNGAGAVLQLRDPIANRKTSHVRLLNGHHNTDR
jgi:hypothetical protein